MMLLLIIPVAVWLVCSMLDGANDREVEEMRRHHEMMCRLEQDALDAYDMHADSMRASKELRDSLRNLEGKRGRRRRERRVIKRADGSYMAQEILEE